MRVLVLLVCCSALSFGQASDFRNARWGMTRAEVLATESQAPSETRQSDGDVTVRYDSVSLAGLTARVTYVFASGKLVRARYLLLAEHAELNDFIGDFKQVEPVLRDVYGKPESERAFWSDDSLQDEPRNYLEQDRATPDSIRQSDRFVGLDISLGHLKLYTQWVKPRTKIVHGLTGQDHRIVHQVEFSKTE